MDYKSKLQELKALNDAKKTDEALDILYSFFPVSLDTLASGDYSIENKQDEAILLSLLQNLNPVDFNLTISVGLLIVTQGHTNKVERTEFFNKLEAHILETESQEEAQSILRNLK